MKGMVGKIIGRHNVYPDVIKSLISSLVVFKQLKCARINRYIRLKGTTVNPLIMAGAFIY